MPRLQYTRSALLKNKLENYERNGWRCAIFGTKPSRTYKDRYKGEWKNDAKEGKGTEISRNGWMYEGDWRRNRKHGHGVLSKVSENGTVNLFYNGEWKEGNREGFGVARYKTGCYEGAFLRNRRHGYGRMWYTDGSYYQGMWEDDQYHGTGMLVQANGNRYEGHFVDGRKEGCGTFYHLDSGQLQIGRWKNDICTDSTLEDISWRQSAVYPTPYPIPENLALNSIRSVCGNGAIRKDRLARTDCLKPCACP